MTPSGELPPRVGVVIPAGGAGLRMEEGRPGGSGVRKQYLELAGEPVLLRALRPFLAHGWVSAIVIALPPEDAAEPPGWLRSRLLAPPGSAGRPSVEVVAGGVTREASVRAALAALPEALDLVVVHDGARPLVTGAIVDRCLEAAAEGVGAVAGVSAVDTIKEVEGRRVRSTPDRRALWHAQTPQAFPREMLLEAYRTAEAAAGSEEAPATDDSALVARCGGTIVMVEGSTRNIKITRPEDVRVAEALLAPEGFHPTTGP